MNTFYHHAKEILAIEKAVGKKERFALFGKLLISAAIVVYFIHKINFQHVITIFVTANSTLLIAAFALSALNIYLQFEKWKLISDKCLGVSDPRTLFLSLMHGIAAGSFTPARIGEYVGRKLAMRNTGLFQVTVATTVDKLFSLFVTLGIGSAAAIIWLHFRGQVSSYITTGLFIVFCLGALLVSYLMTHQSLWNSFLIQQIKQIKIFKNIAYKFSLLKNLDSRTLWHSMLLNIAFYACFLLQYAILLKAFAPEANFVETLWAGSLMFFAKTIIPAISLGELGIREGASVYFAKQFSISEAAGFSAAIGVFIINIALPSLIGMVLFFKRADD